MAMMSQIKDHGNPIEPPAISSDGNDSYPEAMLETWESCRNTLARDDHQLANKHRLGGNVFK
jgi:hypothetical protein